MNQFQIVSDLHLETPAARPTYGDFDVEKRCPNLALLGDIGNLNDQGLYNFLKRQLAKFNNVFFLLGNHEPYGMRMEDAKAKMHAFVNEIEQERPTGEFGKFVFLDQTRFDISDCLTILGCTLWSNISPEQSLTVSLFVSDFQQIEDWTVEQNNKEHASDLEWLNSQVTEIQNSEPHRQVAIFTHHCPTLHETAHDPQHLKDDRQVNTAFMTDLQAESCWTSNQVVLWAFGHTHFNCDFVDTKTGKRVFANQKGYRRSELPTFDEQKVISIPKVVAAQPVSKPAPVAANAEDSKITCCIVI